ncbi:MAG: YhfC family intramembrane metalloprotease [Lachnospiraceae bacterium]|nr:YhfC family intramembrane metalloprotease [Lachnospiraceae bacterium]
MLNLTSFFTAIDGTPQVPMMSMICMATTLALAVVPPVFAIRHAKKKYRGSLKSILFGLAMYVIFEFIILSVVTAAWKNMEAVSSNKVLMAFLEAFLTGFTGIFARVIMILALAKSRLMDNSNSIGNATIAGVGYTLYRTFLIMIIVGQRFVLALTINMFGAGNLSSEMQGEEMEGLADIYEAFLTTPAYIFLIDGIKYLMVLVISVSLAVIIYAVYNKKAHRLLLAFALLINVLFELPFALNYYDVAFENELVMLLVAALFTVWMALLAYKTKNVSLKEEVRERETEIRNAKKQAFPDFNANIKK